ncbi:carbohydrate ABC transporter permease [Mycetocola tolaasinivorans]|uniref:Carbohydrate ABC transporter permease n=1 Tax=Mycetocola tolaasinivorans TaxID=76635 RepID=A0A3L7A3T9_9MICO|nr:carbohydrate ABC transporter permease [Mycetocola tolaasinivorans]RLP74715.1 carbohydrate ABC transporter permease [Mycetocola tolaasinivorans]
MSATLTTPTTETTRRSNQRASAVPPPTKRKRNGRERHTYIYVGVAVVIVYCLAPVYWMAASSLRRTSDIFSLSPLPIPASFESFLAIFDPSQGFLRSLLNSFIIASSVTVLALVVAVTAGYALARLQFRGKPLFMIAVVATSMFPTVALIVPMLKIFSAVGWINTYQALILPSLSFALPLAIWNLTTFFRQMPNDLEQAAMVDGCTRGQAFRRVILPLATPGIFTTAIITFVSAWNEFLIPLTMTNRPDVQPATIVISRFSGVSQFDTPFGSQMAAAMIVTLPLILMVLLFQRRIVSGLAAGALK